MEATEATVTATIHPVDLQARPQHPTSMEAILMSITLTMDTPTHETVAPTWV